jgi:hypothetical protein
MSKVKIVVGVVASIAIVYGLKKFNDRKNAIAKRKEDRFAKAQAEYDAAFKSAKKAYTELSKAIDAGVILTEEQFDHFTQLEEKFLAASPTVEMDALFERLKKTAANSAK